MFFKSGCFWEETDFYGGEQVAINSIASVRDCLKLCRELGTCFKFVYTNQNDPEVPGYCHMKTNQADPVDIRVRETAISGFLTDCENIVV